VTRGQDAAKALNGQIDAAQTAKKELSGRAILVDPNMFDGEALATSIVGSPTAYAQTCETKPAVCREFERALVATFAESLGHHIHVIAESEPAERFAEKPVMMDDEIRSVTVRTRIEPASGGAWYEPRENALPVTLDVYLRASKGEQTYSIRDYSVAGKSVSHALRKQMASYETDGGNALASDEPHDSTWVSVDELFVSLGGSGGYIIPRSAKRLADATKAFYALRKRPGR
jgi:hypothetical protein